MFNVRMQYQPVSNKTVVFVCSLEKPPDAKTVGTSLIRGHIAFRHHMLFSSDSIGKDRDFCFVSFDDVAELE